MYVSVHIELKWLSVVWSDEGRCGGGGADEHCTTKQGHTEGHSEEYYCTQRNTRPHPPCFLSLHETRRRRRQRLLLFTDRLPYLEIKIQTDLPAVCCFMFYVLFNLFSLDFFCHIAFVFFLEFLEKFLFQTRSAVGGVAHAGSFVFLVVKFSLKGVAE